jgi:LysR family glycine cleavage system transcriptional activator
MVHSSSILPPLEALRALEAAAQTGSFSGAAEALNLTHGAVSRQIAKLEHWLGQKVFERHARGVSLTPGGLRLYQRASEAFALIADTSGRWTELRGPSVVKLTSIPSVSGLWLMPRLLALESRGAERGSPGPPADERDLRRGAARPPVYGNPEAGDPDLRIELTVEHRHIDLDAEAIDLAIRCGRGAHPHRTSVRLFEEHCYPIASPEHASALDIGAPERLLALPLIHDSDALTWRAWFAQQGLDYRQRPHDRRFEDYNLVLDAAANGLGIALARPPLVENALRSGRLVRVDHRSVLNPSAYWLDRPRHVPRAAARTLARRIMAEAGLDEATAAAFLGAGA